MSAVGICVARCIVGFKMLISRGRGKRTLGLEAVGVTISQTSPDSGNGMIPVQWR